MTTKIIHDTATGEITKVEMTADEIAQLESDRAAFELKLEKIEETQLMRQSILERLGLTADELKILLG
jgi:hypothetical protein